MNRRKWHHITTPYKKIVTILRNTVFRNTEGPPPEIELLPFRKYGPHSTITFLLKLSDTEQYVIKMPRHNSSAIAQEALEREHRHLQTLGQNNTLRPYIPSPVSLYHILCTPVEVMPFYTGQELWLEIPSEYNTARVTSFFEQAIGFLITLHHVTASDKVVLSSDDTFIDRHIMQPFTLIGKHFPAESGELAQRIDTLRHWSKQQATPLTCCLEHREFNPYNILLLPDRMVVLDWEDADEEGLPLMDLFNYAMVTVQVLSRNHISDSTTAETIMRYTRTYCADIGMPEDSIDLLFCLFMLRNTALFLDPKREALEYSKLWWGFLKEDIKPGIYRQTLLSGTCG